jgi:prepilin-type N-terminal cleavage/methylation domain-containing protein/prepilin-type processing-associated H-X9-DG protein
MRANRAGFTLIELLTVIAVIAVLAALVLPATRKARMAALSARSLVQIRHLTIANHAHANDHRGRFAAATSRDNNTRWHGARTSGSSAFDPTRGYLSSYLGRSAGVQRCPVFEALGRGQASFEETGAGGYGYNAIYIGGTATDPFTAESRDRLPEPARTVMFTDAALAGRGGLQEYPFSEPYSGLAPSGVPTFPLQPSVHFRHNGRAHVAWADGHVTSELPNSRTGPNYYGGDNAASSIGWFGPEDQNGWWNPRRR